MGAYACISVCKYGLPVASVKDKPSLELILKTTITHNCTGGSY